MNEVEDKGKRDRSEGVGALQTLCPVVPPWMSTCLCVIRSGKSGVNNLFSWQQGREELTRT